MLFGVTRVYMSMCRTLKYISNYFFLLYFLVILDLKKKNVGWKWIGFYQVAKSKYMPK